MSAPAKPTKSTQNTEIKKKPKFKNTKLIVIGAIIAVVVIAAVIILPKVFGGKNTSTKITTYNVDEVTYGNISQTVSGSGTLTPVTSETLTSTKGGEVEKVNFTVGDEVTKNAEIAVINGEKITAPCDGILLELPLSVGDEVAQGGSAAMVMGKNGFTMGIAVDETEISSIKLDQAVTFTVDAVSKDFTGKVTKISYNGSSSGGSVAYQITAAFDYAEGIYPGMSATAQIVIEDSGEGLLVPVDAVSTSGDNNYVYLAPSGAEAGTVYEEGKLDVSSLEKVSVKTGMDIDIQRGRKIVASDDEWSTKVCVIGTEAATDLFGTWDAVDGTVIIGDSVYKVVGVLEEQGSSMSGSDDKKILIPYSTATKMTGQKSVSSFYIKAADEDSVDTAISLVKSFLLQITRDEDAYEVRNQSDVLDTMSDVKNTMSLLLAGIAAISLLVGGIGIMNIMLVSVSERTREIGIRKAVGAKRLHIMTQFLCEACILSVLGGIIGLLLSFGAVEFYKLIASSAVSMNWGVGFAAIAFCAVIGVLFGGYPAAKASRLQPIDALHTT